MECRIASVGVVRQYSARRLEIRESSVPHVDTMINLMSSRVVAHFGGGDAAFGAAQAAGDAGWVRPLGLTRNQVLYIHS